jgi:hypothetical protein
MLFCAPGKVFSDIVNYMAQVSSPVGGEARQTRVYTSDLCMSDVASVCRLLLHCCHCCVCQASPSESLEFALFENVLGLSVPPRAPPSEPGQPPVEVYSNLDHVVFKLNSIGWCSVPIRLDPRPLSNTQHITIEIVTCAS